MRPGAAEIARALAARLRLQSYGRIKASEPWGDRQGTGFSSEIAMTPGVIDHAFVYASPGHWLLV